MAEVWCSCGQAMRPTGGRRDSRGYWVDTYVCPDPAGHQQQRGSKPRRKFVINPYISRQQPGSPALDNHRRKAHPVPVRNIAWEGTMHTEPKVTYSHEAEERAKLWVKQAASTFYAATEYSLGDQAAATLYAKAQAAATIGAAYGQLAQSLGTRGD